MGNFNGKYVSIFLFKNSLLNEQKTYVTEGNTSNKNATFNLCVLFFSCAQVKVNVVTIAHKLDFDIDNNHQSAVWSML